MTILQFMCLLLKRKIIPFVFDGKYDLNSMRNNLYITIEHRCFVMKTGFNKVKIRRKRDLN